MADDSKKYLIKIDPKCNLGLKDNIRDVFGYCAELDEVTKGDTYVTYKSETGKILTLLFELEGAEKETPKLYESDAIIYLSDKKLECFEGYADIEIPKPAILEDEKENEKTKAEFIKYIIFLLSERCEVGLMQGYEANNREKVGKKSDKREDNEEECKDDVTKLQRNKYIICDYGDAGTGKSTTLNDVISLMEVSKYTTRKNPIELIYDGSTNSNTDRYAEYEVNGVKISICTQGDPGKEQLDYIQKATQNQMDVIVCAARDDRNGVRNATTVNNVYNGTGIYVKVWYRNFFISRTETNISPQAIDMLSKSMCSTSAKGIVELIEHLMGVRIL